MPSHSRLDYGQFRQEPAITELDWLFTPNRRLEEHLFVAPLQASTSYYTRFTLPTARSPRFGSDPSDYYALSYATPRKLRVYCFRSGFSFLKINLATKVNSLARYSKRTMQHLDAASHYHYQISGSFDSLVRVLFNFPSRYSYAIGL